MPAEDSTLGGLVSMNLPHTLDAQCGSWRDWILGLTVVLADGTIAKGGSLAVKNVAGYDVQKLFIGARGTLGVIVEVILRTFPVKALPSSCAQRGDGDPTGPLWNQRTLRTDFQAASTAPHLVWADPASSTLVAAVPPSESLPRFPHDWVVRSGCAAANLEFADATHVRLMRRAKELLDSQGKLNAGALGVI
jgi:glycolate oxidase FAD binding subunit